MDEQNILSGEHLKKLMVNGKLPEEYISEENINALIDYEFDQMDGDEYYNMSIIGYCSDLIAKNYSDKNYEKRKRETWNKIKTEIKSSSKVKKPAYVIRRIAIVIIAVLIGVQAISVVVFGLNIINWTKDRFFDLLGIETQRDDINHMTSHSREYRTVEELEKNENIAIVIPTWLLNDVEIKYLSYSYGYAKEEVQIFYNDDSTSLSVKLNSPLPNTDGTEIYESNNILFYIFIESNVMLWEYEGNFYNLTCGFDIVEYADEIIKNIK